MRWAVGGFCGYGGSVWVMGEWTVGYWIVGVTSFPKIYGLYGLTHHIVEISGYVTIRYGRRQRTIEDRALSWKAKFQNNPVILQVINI